MKHLWETINLESKYYIQIFKALHLMEFLVKNGATRIIQDLKDDIFKIRTLQDCTYHQDGLDKCRGVREKAKAIVDLISDPERLEEEREFSK
jgi:epsin